MCLSACALGLSLFRDEILTDSHLQCSGLELKAELTSPRAATYQWMCLNDGGLDEALRNEHSQTLSLPPGTFDMTILDFKYQILVHVTDFLGVSTEVVKSVLKKSSPAPAMVFELPVIETFSSEMVLIKAAVAYSACPVSSGAARFSWKQTVGPSLPSALLSSTVPQLLIAPDTLAPGSSYQLVLTAAMIHDPTQTSEATVTVRVMR